MVSLLPALGEYVYLEFCRQKDYQTVSSGFDSSGRCWNRSLPIAPNTIEDPYQLSYATFWWKGSYAPYVTHAFLVYDSEGTT